MTTKRIALMALLLWLGPAAVRAGVVRYEMYGSVISRSLTGGITDADLGLPIGAPVAFRFLVETTAFNSGATTFSEFATYDSYGLTGEFGKFAVFENPPDPTVDALFVSNATPAGFSDVLAGSHGNIDGNIVAGLEPILFDFQLTDDSRTVFGEVALPLSVDAADFDSQFNRFFARNANSTVTAHVYFTISAIEITPVPEPAAMCLAVAGMTWLVRRRVRCARWRKP